MASLNRVILIGNLTRAPELRYTPSGTPVANFGLAVNRAYTNKQGEKAEETDFFNIVVWSRLAELCAEYLDKGRPAAIEGRLQSRSWEAQDGSKRNTVEVVAENVQFLGGPRGAGGGGEWGTSSSNWGEASSSTGQTKPAASPEEVLAEPIEIDEDIPF